ncbi:MAG: OmpA family protein [Zoogloeaceae bacterium]|jgi:outer membrane protein OmpA-like peptidoglycan-associated protein|nr:OmpA family protein [Zoogloeaceae bacterium]
MMCHWKKFLTRLLPFSCLLALLCACQTPPPPPPPPEGKLSQEQITALMSVGFAETEEGWELNLEARLLFDTSSARLNAREREVLDKIAETFLTVGIADIVIEGHTDNTGSARYNRELARKRAQMVAQYLVTRGMQEERMRIKAVGSDNPAASNATAAGRRENRRTVIIVPSQ